MNAISIEEAFAQGSTWPQILSIATFHKRAIKQKVNEAKIGQKRLPDWKAKAANRQLDVDIASHRERVDYFTGLAERMKSASKEVVSNAD